MNAFMWRRGFERGWVALSAFLLEYLERDGGVFDGDDHPAVVQVKDVMLLLENLTEKWHKTVMGAASRRRRSSAGNVSVAKSHWTDDGLILSAVTGGRKWSETRGRRRDVLVSMSSRSLKWCTSPPCTLPAWSRGSLRGGRGVLAISMTKRPWNNGWISHAGDSPAPMIRPGAESLVWTVPDT